MSTCFIAMPVSTSNDHAQLYGDDVHFEHVLVHLMIPAVEEAGFDPIKPVAAGADLIHAEIIRQLETADLVLCDISTLNPNVFFELGIRTAVDKPVCVVKDTLTDRIPFDTSIINVHTYDYRLHPWLLEEQVNALARHLQASAQRSEGRNNLWRYFGLTTRAEFKEGESNLEEKVDLVLLQLKGLESQSRSISPMVALRRNISSVPETSFSGGPDVDASVLQAFRDELLAVGIPVQVTISYTPDGVRIVDFGKSLSLDKVKVIHRLAARYGLVLHLQQ